MKAEKIESFSQTVNRMAYRNEEQPYLTVPEMCKVLRISRKTGYDLVNSEGFPCIRIGRRIIIGRVALNEWAKDHTGNAEAQTRA